MELDEADIDLRELPFRFPVVVATEIEASLYSHPAMRYFLIPLEVSKCDYSNIQPTVNNVNLIRVTEIILRI